MRDLVRALNVAAAEVYGGVRLEDRTRYDEDEDDE
jgi:hypothetical protein